MRGPPVPQWCLPDSYLVYLLYLEPNPLVHWKLHCKPIPVFENSEVYSWTPCSNQSEIRHTFKHQSRKKNAVAIIKSINGFHITISYASFKDLWPSQNVWWCNFIYCWRILIHYTSIIIIICKTYWPVFSVTLFSSVKIEIQSFDRIWFLILTFM